MKEQCSKVDAEDAMNLSILSPAVFWVPLEARLLLAWRYPKSVYGLCLLQKSLLWRRYWAGTHGPPSSLIVWSKGQSVGWEQGGCVLAFLVPPTCSNSLGKSPCQRRFYLLHPETKVEVLSSPTALEYLRIQ